MLMPRAVTLIRSATLSSVAEYAYAATAPAGARLIFLAGACPLNEDGSTAAVGDYAGQAAQAFANMKTALADAGASVEDVISTRVLVASTRREDLGTAWRVIRDAFGAHDVPSTLLGVTVLGYRDQLVELEAVAAVLDLCRGGEIAGGGGLRATPGVCYSGMVSTGLITSPWWEASRASFTWSSGNFWMSRS